MRLSKICIERFSGIRSIDLSVNTGLQLIAGPNNSCKSTVLRAIDCFFKGIDTISRDEFAPQNEYYIEEGSRSLNRVRLHFSELSDEEMAIFSDEWLPRNKEVWMEVRVDRKGKVSYLASNGAPGAVAYEKLTELFDVIYVPAVRAGTNDAREVETRKLFLTAKGVIAKKRRGSLNKIQRDFSAAAEKVTNLLGNLLEESKNSIVESLPSDSEVEFQFPSSDEILDLVLSKTAIGTRANTSLTVDDEGTGFQSLLSLGLLKYVESVNRQRNLLLLVEEPEAFLHPQFQRSVADYLLQLAQKSQVVVTTHSSIIVDSVEIEHICRLIRDSEGLDYEWKWTREELDDAKYLSRYCDATNSEIIFADKVILCEGITDRNVIDCLVNQLLQSTHHHSNISIINGEGSAIRHVAKLLDWFEIEHLIIIDKDLYAGSDRQVLKNICKDKGDPLQDADFVILDRAKSTDCLRLSQAADVRDEANHLFDSRSIFSLGGDIETAVLHSYSRARVLEYLGPENVGLFDTVVFEELSDLTYTEYIERLEELTGAKGWNTKKRNKDNKPKPHLLGNLIQEIGPAHFRQNSDMKALMERLELFVAS